ncbi:MAG: LacI family DNA-binding transcriptional regulator [Acholeplasmataceae bacterium]
MKNKKVTLEDIAKKLNISTVSVYKALSDKQDISDDLKKKVLDMAIKMNYKLIDPLTKLSRKLYYLTPERFSFSTEQFYNGIFLEMKKSFNLIDINLESYIAARDFSVQNFIRERELLRETNYGVFWSGIIPDKILNDFIQNNIPLVVIDYYLPNVLSTFIQIDDYQAGFDITEYLIKLGHHDICFIIETDVSTNADKYFGFRKALHMNKILFEKRMHINLSLSNMDSFLKFTLPEKMPTAFLFDSDFSAKNFMIIALNQGFNIPEDFSVASFDNTKLCEDLTPTLTSIGPNRDDISKSSYKAMLKLMSKPQRRHVNIKLYSEIEIRNSTKNITKKHS